MSGLHSFAPWYISCSSRMHQQGITSRILNRSTLWIVHEFLHTHNGGGGGGGKKKQQQLLNTVFVVKSMFIYNFLNRSGL